MEQRETVTVDQIYGMQSPAYEAVQAVLDRSLKPRSVDSLYDVVGALGIGADRSISGHETPDTAWSLPPDSAVESLPSIRSRATSATGWS